MTTAPSRCRWLKDEHLHRLRRSLAKRLQRGPLMVDRDPPAAYWRGVMIQGIGPSELRVLRMLVRHGKVARVAIDMAHAGTSRNLVAVMIHHLGAALRAMTDEVAIHNPHGWGYRIEVLSS